MKSEVTDGSMPQSVEDLEDLLDRLENYVVD